jgi:hypothetical protein
MLSLTSALDEGGWLKSSPNCFNPGKNNRYTFYRELDGPLGRSGPFQERKYLTPPGFESRTVQPEQSHYTG